MCARDKECVFCTVEQSARKRPPQHRWVCVTQNSSMSIPRDTHARERAIPLESIQIFFTLAVVQRPRPCGTSLDYYVLPPQRQQKTTAKVEASRKLRCLLCCTFHTDARGLRKISCKRAFLVKLGGYSFSLRVISNHM